jgi:hypothetical protein
MKAQLTKLQEDIITGTVLGDGNIEYTKWGSRLQIKQADRYGEYVSWMHSKLESICKAFPKQRNDTKQWYFGTRYLPALTKFRSEFYRNRRKIVPKTISSMLKNPLSLAVWYTDDGRLDWRPKDHYAFTISTDSFSINEVELLGNALRKNFGIDSSIHTPICRGKRYPKLYIGARSRDKFISIVKPYVVSCFSHKVPPL